jgi:hypothetical protein
MPQPAAMTAAFPLARCASCEKDVLTYVMLDEAGAEYRACADCDSPVASEISWVSTAELESVGYQVGKRRPKAGGCGCSSGGCSIRKQ